MAFLQSTLLHENCVAPLGLNVYGQDICSLDTGQMFSIMASWLMASCFIAESEPEPESDQESGQGLEPESGSESGLESGSAPELEPESESDQD